MYESFVYAWHTVVAMGNILPDFTDLDGGFLFGSWHTGPWYGTTVKGENTYGWFGLGDKHDTELQIWHHYCFTFDMVTGYTVLVENGRVRFESPYEEAKNLGGAWGKKANHVSAGCSYRASGTGYMSMAGRITDLQIFGRILTLKEMEDITNCKSFKEGDILSWKKTEWVLSGSQNTSKKETMDLQNDVCNQPTKSYHLIPYRVNFVP